MIERIEVVPGPGTVIRYGGIAAWVAPAASSALISFLAQSSRNLSPSARGGRQIADHIAGVLATRDPEPHVGFVVIGPSDHGWASLLHGPVQAWDGARWLAPAPSPGWIQAIITPRPAITVGPAGTPAPQAEPDAMWDLEAGVVPGAGFVLIPTPRSGRPVAVRTDEREPEAGTVTSVLSPPAATSVIPLVEDTDLGDEAPLAEGAGTGAGAADAGATGLSPAGAAGAGTEAGAGAAGAGTVAAGAEVGAGAGPDAVAAGAVAAGALAAGAAAVAAGAAAPSGRDDQAEEPPVPAPEPVPVPRVPPRPGPAGSLDLRTVTVAAGEPLPRGADAEPAVAGRPVVAGALCPRGHLNRPGVTECVRCHTVIPAGARDTVSGTRPSLGVLVADDGAIYRLDQGYLVGSDPGRDPTVGGGLARPLVLAGNDVSSSHAEVRLIDWDVAVLDRGSAAGTSVFTRGATEWTALRPYESKVIAPGSHVAFGQRVVTFISPWIPAP